MEVQITQQNGLTLIGFEINTKWMEEVSVVVVDTINLLNLALRTGAEIDVVDLRRQTYWALEEIESGVRTMELVMDCADAYGAVYKSTELYNHICDNSLNGVLAKVETSGHKETIRLKNFSELTRTLANDFQTWESKQSVSKSYVTNDSWRAAIWSTNTPHKHTTMPHTNGIERITEFFKVGNVDGVEFIDSAFVNEHGHRNVEVAVERLEYRNELLLVIEGGFVHCRIMKY